MPLCLDRAAPRHTSRNRDPFLADANYVAGYQTAVARIQRVFHHPASQGNERVAAELIVQGVDGDQAIRMLCEQAPLS